MTHSFPTRRSSDLHTGQQAENKKMPAVHTKLLTRKISPKSAPEDQPWAPCAFTTATRARRRSATRGETKGLMSPSSMAISFTSREAMNWRSEEHTSELQSLMRISYAVFCLKK